MAKNEDRRVQKSKRNIKYALIELIQEHELGEISVYDITEKADIGRGTFYLHFQDKFDLFEKYVDELLNELILTIKPSKQEKEEILNSKRKHPEAKERYQQLFKHFQRNASFYQAMFSYKGGPYFYNRFLEELKKYFCQEFQEFQIKELITMNQDVLVYFIAYAFFGIVNYWVTNGMVEAPEEMGFQLDTLLHSLF